MTKHKPKHWWQCECGIKVPPGKECPLCNKSKKQLTIAIGIDCWKLWTFARILDRDGFEFSKGDGPIPDSLILYVVTNDVQKLHDTIMLCQRKCAELRN